MKSLKWEGIGMKNLFPHTSSVNMMSSIKLEMHNSGRFVN